MDKKSIRIFEHPEFDKYPEPDTLKDKHIGQKALIIGGGPSSGVLLNYKDKLRDKFDIIICLNYSIGDFQDCADYLMVLENKPTRLARWLRDAITNTDLTYILNSKAVRFFEPSLNIVKSDRTPDEDGLDIRNYKGGLFDGFSTVRVGTSVAVQALHMAGIFGCSSIHLVGTELFFTDSKYYYTEANHLSHKGINRLGSKDLTQVEIMFNGKKYWSIPVYHKSAESMNKLITGELSRNNIEVSDFSKGLVTEAKQADIDEFFKEDGSI